jgi:hypothetical protein
MLLGLNPVARIFFCITLLRDRSASETAKEKSKQPRVFYQSRPMTGETWHSHTSSSKG